MVGSILVALVASALAGAAARVLAIRVGAVDRPGDLKPHASPTPFLGGVAIGAGLAAGVLVASGSLPWEITLALAGIWILGLADDLWSVAPIMRLVSQLALGLLVAAGGVFARVLPSTGLRWATTAVVFATVINAVNMVDGMDGLAASAGVMSATALAIIAAGSGSWTEALAVALAGAGIGFLLHNRSPARLFLGDNGAYLLAGTLAVIVLSEGATWFRIFGSLTCLGIFNLDLALALLRRIVGKRRLTRGDRSHLYDQLRDRGWSDRRTLGTVLLVHLGFMIAGVGIAHLSAPLAALVAAVVWLIALGALAPLGFLSRSTA